VSARKCLRRSATLSACAASCPRTSAQTARNAGCIDNVSQSSCTLASSLTTSSPEQSVVEERHRRGALVLYDQGAHADWNGSLGWSTRWALRSPGARVECVRLHASTGRRSGSALVLPARSGGLGSCAGEFCVVIGRRRRSIPPLDPRAPMILYFGRTSHVEHAGATALTMHCGAEEHGMGTDGSYYAEARTFC
jgi:hypothetical protein